MSEDLEVTRDDRRTLGVTDGKISRLSDSRRKELKVWSDQVPVLTALPGGAIDGSRTILVQERTQHFRTRLHMPRKSLTVNLFESI